MTVKAVWHVVKESAKSIAWRSWRRTICDGPVLGSATHREASWSRSNFFWDTFRFKRPNATLAANSGFDQRSMIALASSRILELGARLWEARFIGTNPE